MRLASLLASLPSEDLDQLALEHVQTDEPLSRLQLCNLLESAVRSYRFVHDFLLNRQPPSFSILSFLLDAPGYELPIEGFAERVVEETHRISKLIDDGEILYRDGGLQLYRRAFHEARRNDLDVNSSESALLAVIRRETGIAQVEHFLMEHHAELREFWDKEDAYAHEERALRRAGLVMRRESTIIIAEDVVPAIRQTLGIEMPTDATRRLLDHLGNNELTTALEAVRSRTSGTKQARIDRLISERIQPRVILRSVQLPTLRDICRDTGATITGNKDELVDRIIARFAQGRDQQPEPAPVAPRVEQRRLSEEHFRDLFESLTMQELTDILRRFPDLRQSGAKDARISTLWAAQLSEESLLSELMNRDLEEVLSRLRLRTTGSKNERITRIIDHFVGPEGEALPKRAITWNKEANDPPTEVAPAVREAQELFRLKASSPSGLQAWLDNLLDCSGLLRCYATEVANPTQQLKNKLSQAAAARGGLLVLMLVDADAFERARLALLERWGTNDEWPKSVACVALAYPIGAPVIEAIIQWSESPWPDRIRARLFPNANLYRAIGSAEVATSIVLPRCSACTEELPSEARFCPHCGARTSA